MSDEKKYKVVLSGTLMDGFERGPVLIALAALFKSQPAQMAKLLAGNEVPLKKEYSAEQAKKICLAIRNAGAKAKLEVVEKKEIGIMGDGLSLVDDERSQGQCNDSGEVGGEARVNATDDVYTAPKAETIQRDSNSERDDIELFVQRNEDKYLRRFKGMGSVRKPKFSLTWHWPSLFVFFLWAFYRKMWGWAIAYVVVYVASFYFMIYFGFDAPFLATIIYYGSWLIWPCVANYLYFRHVASHVTRARSKKARDEDKFDYLERKGGVSIAAVWVGIGLSVLALYLYMTTLFNYVVDGIQDFKIYRGDGSVISSEITDRRLKKTGELLFAVGLTIQLLDSNRKQIIQSLQSDSRQSDEDMLDGWNRPIVIIDEGGQVIVLSLGPDGVQNTKDDVYIVVDNSE